MTGGGQNMKDAESARKINHKTRRLLSIKQVEDRLNCSASTVRRLIRDGELAACKVRGSVRVPSESLDNYIQDAIYDFAVNNGEAKF